VEETGVKGKIGITERGDAALDTSWISWVRRELPAILISKDPGKLLSVIKEEDLPLERVIIHATITGFGGGVLEPNTPNWREAFVGYKDLVNLLGVGRVILRIDPVIPTDIGLERALTVLEEKEPGVGRVRVSFLDGYNHVRRRFEEKELPLPWEGIHAPIEMRREALAIIEAVAQQEVEVCGEPGMKCTGCISSKDLDILKVSYEGNDTSHQRKACACLAMKHELLSKRNPCGHGCLYCYWKD
jgi:hypothetical protein